MYLQDREDLKKQDVHYPPKNRNYLPVFNCMDAFYENINILLARKWCLVLLPEAQNAQNDTVEQ